MSEKKITIRLERKDDYHDVENLTRESFWNVYRPGCMEHCFYFSQFYILTTICEYRGAKHVPVAHV